MGWISFHIIDDIDMMILLYERVKGEGGGERVKGNV